MESEILEKTTKVISFPFVARKLLKKGYTIVDIKAKKEDPLQTLFIFRIEDSFLEDYDLVMKKYQAYLARKEEKEAAMDKGTEKDVQRDFTSRFHTR